MMPDSHSQSKRIEEHFTRLETEWMNAWKNKDESRVRQLMAEDFTLTSSLSSGELVDKESWIEKAMHQYSCKSFSINQIKVRLYGNTAVLNIRFCQEAEANGRDWSGEFLLTDVWIQIQGNWQVVARHSTWLGKMK